MAKKRSSKGQPEQPKQPALAELPAPEPPRSPLRRVPTELLSAEEFQDLRLQVIDRLRRSLSSAADAIEGLLVAEDEAVRRRTALDLLAFGEIYLGEHSAAGPAGPTRAPAESRVPEMLATAVRDLVGLIDKGEDLELSIPRQVDAEVLKPNGRPAKAPHRPAGGKISPFSGLDPAVEGALSAQEE